MMWSKEKILSVGQNKNVRLVTTVVISTLFGAGTSHLVTKKLLEKKYDERTRLEVSEAKNYYQQKNKTGEYSDPSALADKYRQEDGEIAEALDEVAEEAKPMAESEISSPEPGEEMEEFESRIISEAATKMRELKYHAGMDHLSQSDHDRASARGSIKKNIFDSKVESVGELDPEMINDRSPDEPYIITHDEFFNNESDRSQTTLTYYEGDKVLTDERDKDIPQYQQVIGVGTLKFGYASQDENIVYVCNEKLDAIYEITRSPGSYSHEVLGLDAENELEHSDRPRIRKMRNQD